jgi:hypothetical protein
MGAPGCLTDRDWNFTFYPLHRLSSLEEEDINS